MMLYKKGTKKLYELIRSKRKNTTLEEVKEIFEKGIDIQGVYCKNGGILFNCIDCDCPPEVLEYLYNQGVQDEKTLTEWTVALYINEDDSSDDDSVDSCDEIIDERIVIYATCKNLLVWWYHKLVRSCRIYNQIGLHIADYEGTTWPYEHILNHKREPIQNHTYYLDLCEKYCKILGIYYSNLQNEFLELPPNIKDFSNIPTWMFE